MSNVAGAVFCAANLHRADIEGRDVLEVGARDVNGSIRAFVASRAPATYLGVDIEAGPGVDRVCDATRLVAELGRWSFDVVIAMELLEHVRDWRAVVSNLKNVCRPDGLVLITTRSIGFKYHGYPSDFWRYELDDMRAIFADCLVERLEPDPTAPGVFLKVRLPRDLAERDLSALALHSVLTGTRALDVDDAAIAAFQRRQRGRRLRKRLERGLVRLIRGGR